MLPLPLLKQSDALPRECGSCTVCCTLLSVSEINKSMGQDCVHMGEGCCKIYETRPHSCKVFDCMWLTGHIQGDLRRRPDNLGLMFLPPKKVNFPFPVLTVWEVWEGAAKQNLYILDKLSKHLVLYILRYKSEEREIAGPPNYMAMVKDYLKKATGNFPTHV
jgi:Fe-S-cluster containining protein